MVEHWSEDMEILRAIAAAFAARDLSQLDGILERISY